FQTGNETMADADDAGIVLSTFGLALEHREHGAPLPEPTAGRVRASAERGREWLRAMQNSDGGWSAFVCDLPIRPSGAILTRALDLRPDDPMALLGALATGIP